MTNNLKIEAAAETGQRQYGVMAANGVRAHASEDVARNAIIEGGYTLGSDRSPIVAALVRETPNSPWREFDPTTDQSAEPSQENR